MPLIKTIVTSTAIAVAALAAPVAVAQDDMASMSADIMDADGEQVGTVVFTNTPSGLTHLAVELENLPPGSHGFHVHETGICDAEDGFKSAGGHYAGDKAHGFLSPDGPHPGDFPNIHVAPDGVVVVQYVTDALTVGSEGENPLADEDGSAVVIHEGPDDYESQPAGDAGSRIACGVIR